MTKTPRSQIYGALRQLWMRSRERAECMKINKYTCERCGIKQSKKKGMEVKVNVHHRKGVTNWQKIIDMLREELLCNPELLEVLCVDCHKKEHKDN